MHITQKINILANEMLGEAGLELYKALEERGWEDERQTKAIMNHIAFMVMSFTHEDIGEIFTYLLKQITMPYLQCLGGESITRMSIRRTITKTIQL